MLHSIPMRLSHFPIMFFAVVMGFGGLSLAWHKASLALDTSSIPATILEWLSFLFFVIITGFYIAKFLIYRHNVIKEYNHPVRINFFAAFSISLLILSMQDPAHFFGVHIAFIYIGTIAQSYITLYVIRFWIERSLEISHSSPAWFIPVVGNLIIPIAAKDFLPFELLYFYFSVGLFFWVILFSVIAYRLIFHPQMAQKFVPTLFIFIAPPAIGFLVYIKLFESYDLIATALFNLALFFIILLLFMGRGFLKLKFFISWWAFIFPLAAMALATISFYTHHKTTLLFVASWGFLLLATLVFFVVCYKTIEAIIAKEICIEE